MSEIKPGSAADNSFSRLPEGCVAALSSDMQTLSCTDAVNKQRLGRLRFCRALAVTPSTQLPERAAALILRAVIAGEN